MRSQPLKQTLHHNCIIERKVLGRAELRGPTGSVLCSGQANVLLLAMPSSTPLASRNIFQLPDAKPATKADATPRLHH